MHRSSRIAAFLASSSRLRRPSLRPFIVQRSAFIIASLACLLAGSGPAGAARPDATAEPVTPHLTLSQAIQSGLDRHPALARAEAVARGATSETKQTRGRLYPWIEASAAGSTGSLRVRSSDGATIHATGDLAAGFLKNRAGLHLHGGGRGFALAGALPQHNQNMVTGGLIVNQLITDFGNTAHRILANTALEEASEKDRLMHKALVVLNVQQAYFTCLMQQRLTDIAAENLEKRQAIREQIAAFYRHQVKSKLDLDLVTVEVRNAELALIKARNDVTQAFAALNHAMGVEGPAQYRLEAVPVQPESAPDPAGLVEQALKSRPELLGSQDRLQATRELLEAVKALHLGEISAVGAAGMTQYGDVHDGGIPPDGFATFWGFGVTARLPLFTGFKIQQQVVEAGHRRGQAEQDIQQTANEVTLQVVRATVGQVAAAEQIRLEEERVAFAKEAVDLAQARYKLGLSSIVEVIRAVTAQLDAESRLAEARYVYKKSQALVAYAAGQDYLKYK